MTIGIAASGPNAGLAIFRALGAVESVGTGSIGGFVSFVAITPDGTLIRASTQRGGTQTLFDEGGDIPAEFATATTAALMSSGPDRPEPLSQFTPGEAGIGLVSGHRLPNADTETGGPLNAIVLNEMRGGRSARDAIRIALDNNKEADAGLIAVDNSGAIAIGNSQLVAQRPDIGEMLHIGKDGGLSVGVLHNAIFPHRPLAALAMETALHSVAPIDLSNGEIILTTGIPICASDRNRVHVDNNHCIRQIDVSQHSLAQPGQRHTAAIPFLTDVIVSGEVVGHTIQEPYCIVKNGVLDHINGADRVKIAVRWIGKDPD